jgi:hypothetical protein
LRPQATGRRIDSEIVPQPLVSERYETKREAAKILLCLVQVNCELIALIIFRCALWSLLFMALSTDYG